MWEAFNTVQVLYINETRPVGSLWSTQEDVVVEHTTGE